MDFYLSYNNGAEQLRLPITPSSFEVSQKHNNTVVNITSIGEIALIGKAALSTMNISSFFPKHEYYFCKYKGFPKPYECVRVIQKWKKENKPIRLIVTGTPINYAVTIESFVFSEQDGTGDVYFTLSLREYVIIQKNKEIEVTTPNGTKVTVPPTKRETKPIPATYKVQKNDNIHTISKKTTGSMSNGKAIANKNKAIIGPNYGNLSEWTEMLI